MALSVIAVGAVAGAALVGRSGADRHRLRVPSIVAAAAALGLAGAQTLALLLFVTNFAWIALNNVIAASICAGSRPSAREGLWAVAARPRGHADRARRPAGRGARRSRGGAAAAAVGRGVHGRVLARAVAVVAAGPDRPADIVRGLDIVAGYQVSWLLMFADYPRFVRSARGAGIAVFLGPGADGAVVHAARPGRRRRSRTRRIRARWCSRSASAGGAPCCSRWRR